MSSEHADNSGLNITGPEVKEPDFQGFTIATHSDDVKDESTVESKNAEEGAKDGEKI